MLIGNPVGVWNSTVPLQYYDSVAFSDVNDLACQDRIFPHLKCVDVDGLPFRLTSAVVKATKPMYGKAL